MRLELQTLKIKLNKMLSKEKFFNVVKILNKNYRERWKPNTNPYQYLSCVGILDLFTPIEEKVWADIRYMGLPFYPQWQVGKYYLDFADPVKKIGIEVDGKIHQNISVANKDKIKEKYLYENGWKLFRIAGYTCYKTKEEVFTQSMQDVIDEADEDMKDFYIENFQKDCRNECSQVFLEYIQDKFYK